MSGLSTTAERPGAAPPSAEQTAFSVIFAIGFCHLLNDMMQSLLPAIYPGLKTSMGLSFGQLGMVSFVYQITASILQPLVGFYADKRPMPLALPSGPAFTLAGLTVLSVAHTYPLLLVGACLLGLGSSVFHPECSRVARMAAGRRFGLSQSIFQVGGNAGSALGPLAAAVVVVRWGQSSVAFFALLALLSSAILWQVSRWYRHHSTLRVKGGTSAAPAPTLPPGEVRRGMAILLGLVFSKFIYIASLTNFFTFYLMHRFGISVRDAQLHLFVLLAGVAVGTIVGGPLGDRFGRKYVIWFSVLAPLPLTLLLPHVNLFWTGPLALVIGLILSSAFPAIVVFAQELAPGRVGMISGLFFGFSFGVAGLGAAGLGALADRVGIAAVYEICAFLPLIGLLAAFLPNPHRR